ncbi:MAG: hypothetical protein WCG47_13875 [Dermatophilaceae bacterium]
MNVRTAAGGWARVDSSLGVNGKGRLATKATGMPVSFAESSAAPELVRAGAPGRSVGLRAANAADRRGAVEGSAVTYTGVWPGADLQFRAGNGVAKTTVVLSKPPAADGSVWRFPLGPGRWVDPEGCPVRWGADRGWGRC